MNTFTATNPEISDIDVVNAYCTSVLLSQDSRELDAASNQYMGLFRTDPEFVTTSECMTGLLDTNIYVYEAGEPTENRKIMVDFTRLKALKYVARACVEGGDWPIQRMADVFDVVQSHIEGVSLYGKRVTPRQARSYMRQEVRGKVSWGMTADVKERKKEALKLLASPLSIVIRNMFHPVDSQR